MGKQCSSLVRLHFVLVAGCFSAFVLLFGWWNVLLLNKHPGFSYICQLPCCSSSDKSSQPYCNANSDQVHDCSTHVGATTMVQVNSPACNHCGSQDMRSTGSAQPTAEEAQSDAGRVEVHTCSSCNCTTRSTVLLCCMHNTFRLAPPAHDFRLSLLMCAQSCSFASTVPCAAQPCSQHASSTADLHAYPCRLPHVGRPAFMVLMQH